MHTFTDAKNRTWVISITVSSLRRIRSATGVDFANIQIFSNEKEMERLASDAVLLSDILHAALLPQLEQNRIEKDDFCDSIMGNTITDAFFALMNATADFFPQVQATAIKDVLRLAKQQMDKANSELLTAVGKLSTDVQPS